MTWPAILYGQTKGLVAVLEREAERGKQREGVLVIAGGGDERDVHTTGAVDLIQRYSMRQETSCSAMPSVGKKSPATVEAARRTDRGSRGRAAERRPSRRSRNSHMRSPRRRDLRSRSPGPRAAWKPARWTSWRGWCTGCWPVIACACRAWRPRAAFESRGGRADTHVHDDLLETRNVVDVGDLQLGLELADDLVLVLLFETRSSHAISFR